MQGGYSHDDLAMLAKQGRATKNQLEQLASALMKLASGAVWTRVGRGLFPWCEAEDAIQETTIRAYQKIATWDASRGKLTTWVGTIANHEMANIMRDKMNEKSAIDAAAGKFVNYDDIRPCSAIANHPDALYEWEERIGIMQADGIGVTPADLAKIRNHILKAYNLREKYRAYRKHESN